MSTSSSRIWPSVGRSKPAIMRRVVVLPQPEGPRSEKNWPKGISRLIPATAVNSPKRFTRSTSWTSPPAIAGGAYLSAPPVSQQPAAKGARRQGHDGPEPPKEAVGREASPRLVRASNELGTVDPRGHRRSGASIARRAVVGNRDALRLEEDNLPRRSQLREPPECGGTPMRLERGV